MTRRMTLSFPNSRTRAIAELLDDQAPQTSEAVWQALETPAENDVIHAMYCGRELIFALPAGNRPQAMTHLPRENEIILPQPGDVCFKYFPPYEINLGGAETAHADGLFDFMIFYGRNARLFSSQGWVPVNLFARVVEGLEELAVVGSAVHKRGMQPLRLERFE